MSQVIVAEPVIQRGEEKTIVQVHITVPGCPSQKVEYVLPPVGVHRGQVIDAMFVIGRVVAMKQGWELVLPGPVSARLIDRSEIMQDIFLEWFTTRAKAMPLDFDLAEPLDLPADRGVLSTFSGGVDSYYTALENRDRLSALLFVHGLDIGLQHTEFRARVSNELAVSAADLGLPLWEVETNVRDLTNPFANWAQKAHGAVLSSVAILLAQRVDTFLIPGTVTRGAMDGQGWGSHVVTDRLNSTDYLSIVHHGADTPRPEKTARIAQSETALRHLRVCYTSRTLYNCGRCRKCRRTLIDLHLAGVTDQSGIFGDAETLKDALEQVDVKTTVSRALFEATLTRARALGRKDIAVPIKRAIQRHDAEMIKRDAIPLRSLLRKDREFRALFAPRRRRPRPKPAVPAPTPPPPTPPPPTLRALVVHRLPDPVVRRLRGARRMRSRTARLASEAGT
ncbi:MAG: hypothetical protein ABIR34_01725 [Marmoricola sp.]